MQGKTWLLRGVNAPQRNASTGSPQPERSAAFRHMSTEIFRWHQYQDQSNNCGPFSLAIAANALLGEIRFNGKEVAEEMNRLAFKLTPLPHPVIRRIPNSATFPWGITQYLQSHKIGARWHMFGTKQDLLRNIEEDRITIVIIGEPFKFSRWKYEGWAHAKVLYGYDPQQGYAFIDPAFRLDPEGKGISWQSEGEFERQWRGLGSIYIEVGE